MPKLQVTASSLNVREQPSVESRAVGFLQRDDVVEVLGGIQGNKVGVSLYAKADLLGYRTVGTS